VATAAGDRATRRRGGRRQQPEPTPTDVGGELKAARDARGITLEEVHDRTGVSRPQLEALEVGDLVRFPDRRSLVIAVRRYADLVELPADALGAEAERRWAAEVLPSATSGVTSALSPGGPGYGGTPTGHLSRYPGDGAHLRAFTQTAEVPQVGGWSGYATAGHMSFTGTGSLPAIARPVVVRPAPYALRVLVWVTAGLLALGLVGVAVHHWRPKWLAEADLVHHVRVPRPGTPFTLPPPHLQTITQTSSGPGSAAITVRAAQYAVVVGAWQPCWVQAESPQSFTPLFNQTLATGQSHTFDSADGQLTLHLGASFVTIEVEIANKVVPGWTFRPSSAPFVINFTSALPAAAS